MNKRIFATLLSLLMIFTLTACGSSSAPAQQPSAPNGTTPFADASGRDTPSSNAAESVGSEDQSGANALDSIKVTHLDDFKQYGFTFEALPEGEYFETSIRGYQYALISDSAKIYFGDGMFSYEVDLFDGNLRDVHQTDVHIPGMEVGDSYRYFDVGYGLRLADAQMKYMGFVAKCFFENPSSPFAHLVPQEIADAAAQNDIYINVKYANGGWQLLFISLQYSYVNLTYSDGSQDIIANAAGIYQDSQDKTKVGYFDTNGVSFDNPAYNTVRNAINDAQYSKNYGGEFNYETLEWSFTPEITSALTELMQVLNTPYEE